MQGGQSVMNPWPIIGGVAKSICKMEDIIMYAFFFPTLLYLKSCLLAFICRPVNAVAGDAIVLTKPLGTQVAVNVRQYVEILCFCARFGNTCCPVFQMDG